MNVPSGRAAGLAGSARSSAIRSLDRERARGELARGRASSSFGLGLGQEADLAEVDAEDRDVDLGDRSGGAQERAVAAEHDEHVGVAQLVEQCRRLAGGAAHCSMPRIRHQPAARSRSSSAASLVGL